MLLTSKSAQNSIVEGLKAGADDYLIKPFDCNELMARLVIGERILKLEERLEYSRKSLPFILCEIFLQMDY